MSTVECCLIHIYGNKITLSNSPLDGLCAMATTSGRAVMISLLKNSVVEMVDIVRGKMKVL